MDAIPPRASLLPSSSNHVSHPPQSTSKVSGPASRILSSMRKSFSYSNSPRKRQGDISSLGMYSTPEERNPHFQSRSHHADAYATRPTIEQIAMGLHISRTPHLRQAGSLHQRYSAPSSPSIHHKATNYTPHATTSNRYDASCPPSKRRSLPPPPTRSSLKKFNIDTPIPTPVTAMGLPAASLSTSTVTSMGPMTPESARSVLSLKRISKFLPSLRSSSSSSPASSVSGIRPLSKKKAVRFSTSVLELDGTIPSHHA